MHEISNKTLSALLLAALFLSMMGTLTILNTDKGIHRTITGYGIGAINTTPGNVSFTISDITWINFSRKSCFFGTGYAKAAACILNTSNPASGGINSTGCSSGFSANWGCLYPLEIANIGNNNVSLNLSWKNNSKFIDPNGNVWFKMVNNSVAYSGQIGCREKSGAQTFYKFSNTWQPVNFEGQTNITCSRLSYTSGANRVSMYLKVRFTAATTRTGARTNIITAIGKSV